MRSSVTAVALSFAVLFALVVAAPTAAPDVSQPAFPYLPGALTPTTIYDEASGLRNVSYFLDSHGLAIIDLDIIYGTEEHLHQAEARAQAVMASGGSHVVPRAYVERNKPWPGATLRYRFSSSLSENNFKAKVNEAIQRWKTKAPYIQFKPEATGNWNSPGVLTIWGENEKTCSSSVGYSTAYTNMHLGPGCKVGDIVHEFGHVLGLWHEMIRPDRDTYITVKWENIVQGGAPTFEKDKNPNLSRDWSSPYDINSIMHYRSNALGIGGKTVLESKTNVPVPTDNGQWPSEGDFKAICGLYTCECPQAKKPSGC